MGAMTWIDAGSGWITSFFGDNGYCDLSDEQLLTNLLGDLPIALLSVVTQIAPHHRRQ